MEQSVPKSRLPELILEGVGSASQSRQYPFAKCRTSLSLLGSGNSCLVGDARHETTDCTCAATSGVANTCCRPSHRLEPKTIIFNVLSPVFFAVDARRCKYATAHKPHGMLMAQEVLGAPFSALQPHPKHRALTAAVSTPVNPNKLNPCTTSS